MLVEKVLETLRDDKNSIDKLVDLFENLSRVPQVLQEVRKLREEVKQIQMDLTNLATAFGSFATDFGKFKTDFTTFLGTVVPANPAQQQQIDTFTQQLSEFDNQVKQMDESLNLPANPPGGGV